MQITKYSPALKKKWKQQIALPTTFAMLFAVLQTVSLFQA
jgi:hypothetical protein